MNREEIVALAEKAGFERLFPGIEDWVCFTEEIERFYKMVVAAEREAFAKESSATEQPEQQQELTPYMIHANGAIQRITPSKPWVGLEESEWREIDDRHDWTTMQGRIDAAEEIEAKLREKNAQPIRPLTDREVELLDGMIEVQLDHAKRCDSIANRPMAEKQKAWDMERVELLRKLKSAHGIKGDA